MKSKYDICCVIIVVIRETFYFSFRLQVILKLQNNI